MNEEEIKIRKMLEQRSKETEFEQLDRILEEKGSSYEELAQLALNYFGDQHTYTQAVIEGLATKTEDYFAKYESRIDEYYGLSDEELKEKLNEELAKKNSDEFLFIQNFIYAREAYEGMFRNFRNIVSKPEYFLAALIDSLDEDFNISLFVYTKELGATRGLIFNLEDGLTHAHRMGLLLTPLAFSSARQFLQTIFHELSHRLLFARYGVEKDKEEHEFYAYFQDKLLTHFFESECDVRWLDPVFEMDLMGFLDHANHTYPNHLDEVVTAFMPNIKRMKANLRGLVEDEDSKKKLSRRCFSAARVLEIPKNYQSILDFLWLYSSRLSALRKMGHMDAKEINSGSLLLLLMFSQRYESEHHKNDETMAYQNVVFHANGEMGSTTEEEAKRLCGQLKEIYKEADNDD